jgi:hypothetical protein
MNREAIYSALFTLAASAPGLITTSRKLKHWNDLSASEMPALFLTQGQQTPATVTGQPTRWELNATLWVYVPTLGANSPGEVLNPILDSICKNLDYPFPGQPQTLGGLVQYARIDGTIETSEGTLGDIEVVRIPVKMLAV